MEYVQSGADVFQLGAFSAAPAAGAGGGTGISGVTPISGGVSAMTSIFSGVSSAIASNDARNLVEDLVVAKLNAVELAMLLTRDQYLSGPATAEAQQAALSEIDAGIAWLNGPELGKNVSLRGEWRRGALADRNRGGKYDWYAAYRDPIADDPRRQSFTGQITGQLEGAAQVIGLKGSQLVFALSAVGIGLWLVLRSKS